MKLAVRFVRLLSGAALLGIVLLLVPLGLPYLENASAYAWVRVMQEADQFLIGGVKSIVPTKVGGWDLARLILIAATYALSRILEAVANAMARMSADRDVKRRYDAFKKNIGLPENSKALAPIKKKLDALKPGDAQSREDLIRLMIETKKRLDSMARDVAFLSIDVAGSTDMKVGEDKAFIEHDFKEYKKLVESAMSTNSALKSAWTPDGVMICFSTADEAIRAAQEVLVGLEKFNREVKAVKTQFRVRCGINAGRVHYDKATRMEEMSDRVIDIAGHMQKYAAPDTIFIAREALEKVSNQEGFQPAGQEVDGLEVCKWKAPSADPTMLQTNPKRAAVAPPPEAPQPDRTRLTPLSELSNPKGVAAPPPHELTAKIEARPAPAEAIDPRALPTRLGKYEVRRELGRGAMGVVYEGWDPHIERRVALKTIRPDQLDSTEAEEILTRFRREAKAAGRLSHPNIVAVYEFGQEGSTFFIAMEYIEGRELKDYFDKDEHFPLPEIVRMMSQLLDALDMAGRNGIVHRDIKPSNIILLPDGTVKVADFGIARIESSHLTQMGAALGTPSYMSPEQLMGQPVDGRSDLFSAAVVLYQFLTGEKPFAGERTTTIITKVLSEQPPDPSQLNVTLPRSFDAAMRKGLAKRPDERYQSGREFAEALKAALSNPDRQDNKASERKDDDNATLLTTRTPASPT